MKECPECAGPLVDLRSMNSRICIDCHKEFQWHLSPGQKPLIGPSRQDRKEQAQ